MRYLMALVLTTFASPGAATEAAGAPETFVRRSCHPVGGFIEEAEIAQPVTSSPFDPPAGAKIEVTHHLWNGDGLIGPPRRAERLAGRLAELPPGAEVVEPLSTTSFKGRPAWRASRWSIDENKDRRIYEEWLIVQRPWGVTVFRYEVLPPGRAAQPYYFNWYLDGYEFPPQLPILPQEVLPLALVAMLALELKRRRTQREVIHSRL